MRAPPTRSAAVVRAAAPDLAICFGQAEGRTGISIERFAHNLDGPDRPDNDGVSSGVEIDPEWAGRVSLDAAGGRDRRGAACGRHPGPRVA